MFKQWRILTSQLYFHQVITGVFLLMVLSGCAIDTKKIAESVSEHIEDVVVDTTNKTVDKTIEGSVDRKVQSTTEQNIPAPKVANSPDFDQKLIEKLAIVVRVEKKYENLPYRRIEDQFMLALLNKGYQIASRSDIDNIVEELNFQYSSLSEENIAEIGKVLNVSEVLIVSVTDLQKSQRNNGEHYTSASLGARLLGVEKGKVLWMASCSGDGDEEGKLLEKIAEQIATAFPLKSDS